MQDERVHERNDEACDSNGRYALYWMQQSQRVGYNHALEYAIREARNLGQGVVVAFGVMDDYPEANARHYDFMLRGLAEVDEALANRGVKFVLRHGNPAEVALSLAEHASFVVCDRGYLRHQRQWRERVAREAGKRVVEVESDVVVPVETASDKREYAARTIRKKINEQRERFLSRLSASKPAKSTRRLRLPGAGDDLDAREPAEVLAQLEVDRSVAPIERFEPGYAAAKKQLQSFIRSRLEGYDDSRNDPADPAGSMLSPYLHFGQISPVEIALKVREASSGSDADKETFLEELIVRRELAANFCWFARDDYDSYDTLPEWARTTLAEHRDDEREQIYTRDELEAGETDDEYFNAAMREMKRTGYMHNYLRMYWGKRIIGWTNTPEYAYETALYLNNKYFLDGRDHNSYANVGWLFGLHDRAWTERDVFGKVRYMSAGGLERKFDIDRYVEWTRSL